MTTDRRQVPINVGDADCRPLFPYGWGLRTDKPRSALEKARDAAHQAVLGGRARSDWARLIADADNSQARGDEGRAYWLLRQVPR